MKQSQRTFVSVTLLTVLSIAIVIVVYAAMLGGPYPGGEVKVGGVTLIAGTPEYSLVDQTGAWSPTLDVATTGTSWFARINTTGNEYVGPVRITWHLEKLMAGPTWTDVSGISPHTTDINLIANSQTIYCSSNGDITTNNDWKNDISAASSGAGSYRVVVTIESRTS